MGRSRQTVRKTLQSSHRTTHNISTPPLPSTSDDTLAPSAQIQSDAPPPEEPTSKPTPVPPPRNPFGDIPQVSSRFENNSSAPVTPRSKTRQVYVVDMNRRNVIGYYNRRENRNGGEDMGQRRSSSGWMQKFPQRRPFMSGVYWNSRRRPEGDGREDEGEVRPRAFGVPSAGCSLSRQEGFAKELSKVLRKGMPLTCAMNFVDMDAPEDIAKSIMTDEEWKMYEVWNGGENLPEEDWGSMVEDVEDCENRRDAEDWEQNAMVLNAIYRRNDLTKRHARGWWRKNAAWKPLANAVLLMRKEQQISELIACKEVMTQMEQHLGHIERRSQLYARHFVRKYKENVAVVMNMLRQRLAFLQDDNNLLGEPLPNVINVPDDS